jgi:Carboxypeptidase regulatory-like domain
MNCVPAVPCPSSCARMNPVKARVLALLAVFLGAIRLYAAITGSISGIVTDPSGALIPGVTVVATSASTNIQHTTVTDSKGFYSFPVLNVDVYNVTAAQAGF